MLLQKKFIFVFVNLNIYLIIKTFKRLYYSDRANKDKISMTCFYIIILLIIAIKLFILV
jgi:uncharacterized membrane protein